LLDDARQVELRRQGLLGDWCERGAQQLTLIRENGYAFGNIRMITQISLDLGLPLRFEDTAT
jgi:hypothetical protein